MELEAQRLAAHMLSATTPEMFKEATRIVAMHMVQRVSHRAWSNFSRESQEGVISASVPRIYRTSQLINDLVDIVTLNWIGSADMMHRRSASCVVSRARKHHNFVNKITNILSRYLLDLAK